MLEIKIFIISDPYCSNGKLEMQLYLYCSSNGSYGMTLSSIYSILNAVIPSTEGIVGLLRLLFRAK